MEHSDNDSVGSRISPKAPVLPYGEQIAVAIIKKQDSSLSAEDVREYCRENIANCKVSEYVEEYPMTASAKIQKYKLRESAIGHCKPTLTLGRHCVVYTEG
jgi:acyl-CoA synthetase (AMP-forming)/AMP-acid ligase II